MKVYIVTQGDFSEYRIERVFSTRDKAQEYLDHIGNYDCRMEEYNIDEEVPCGLFIYSVILYGNISSASAELMDAFSTYYPKNGVRWKADGAMCFSLEAKDAPHAIKIASERLMQIKAMPYLFPRLKEVCVCTKYSSGYIMRETPIYNYITKEILLDDNQYIEP